MKIVAISDTHNNHYKLQIPECDILIHAGDWTSQGKIHEVEDFARWLNKQRQAKHIVIVPGNHELYFEKYILEYGTYEWVMDHCPRTHLLIDRTIEIEGVKIHGSPATPFFCDWAWNRSHGNEMKAYNTGYGKIKYPAPIKPHWDKIPEGTNILITHGPPYDILDKSVYANGDPRPEPLGCDALLNRIQEVKPDLHFFGHIHAPGGTQVHKDGTSFYNASICDETYFPSNPITIVEYEKM